MSGEDTSVKFSLYMSDLGLSRFDFLETTTVSGPRLVDTLEFSYIKVSGCFFAP